MVFFEVGETNIDYVLTAMQGFEQLRYVDEGRRCDVEPYVGGALIVVHYGIRRDSIGYYTTMDFAFCDGILVNYSWSD